MTADYLNKYNLLASIANEGLAELFVGDNKLYRAMSYSLQAGGKRLRPVLVLATAELLELSTAKFLPFALATELIHTASLIHDDLPILDDDDLRRGKPSCHKAFGEGIALLAGDAMLSAAYSLVVRSEQLSPAARVSLTSVLTATFDELCLGQTLDLEAFQSSALSNDAALPTLQKRHSLKTGALLKACLVGPLLGGEAEGSLIAVEVGGALQSYGEQLGVLFQIVDDILDVIATPEESGKTAHSDSRHGLTTYVSIFGLDGARRRAEEAHRAAVQALEIFKEKGSFHSALCDEILQRAFPAV